MVNRKNTSVARDIDKLNDNDSPLFSTRQSQKEKYPLNDDLIVSLSNAYENKRARQVQEWERVGFQNIYRT